MVFDFFSILLRFTSCKDGKLTPIIYSECLITDDDKLRSFFVALPYQTIMFEVNMLSITHLKKFVKLARILRK